MATDELLNGIKRGEGGNPQFKRTTERTALLGDPDHLINIMVM